MHSNYFDDESRLLPHGIMFHHFHHVEDKPYAQGSITANNFEKIIEYIGPDNILPANEWLVKAINNELGEKEICLTFDDALKCQIEIAFPVLQKFGLTAFWFIFSSVFVGNINRLEIYKYFYNIYFPNFDEFYRVFEKYLLESGHIKSYEKSYNRFLKIKYLIEFDFYSEKERAFRFYRDRVLKKREFETLMDKMLTDHGVDTYRISKSIWMGDEDLLMLNSFNHVIGLHSFSHPTNMKQLDVYEEISI